MINLCIIFQKSLAYKSSAVENQNGLISSSIYECGIKTREGLGALIVNTKED